MPDTLKYEHDMIVAEGNLVIVHGRFSGFGAPASWIAADILVMEEGVLVEHWDVIQDEATRAQSKSGNSATQTAELLNLVVIRSYSH
jgi:predicted SnoaL-like aldol condensation-catalyzing enzyme